MRLISEKHNQSLPSKEGEFQQQQKKIGGMSFTNLGCV